jgi:hypothetical protein
MTEEKSIEQYIQEFVDYIAAHKETNYDLYVKTNKLPDGYWNFIVDKLISKDLIKKGIDGKYRPTPILDNYTNGKYLEGIEEEKLKSEILKHKQELIDALTINNYKLQNDYIPLATEQLRESKKYYWIGIICSVLGTLLGVWLGSSQSDTQKQTLILDATPIHDTVYNRIYDTIYISSETKIK